MKRVLVLGGGLYQIPLIKRIVELGHEAYCIDYNQAAPGFDYATKYAVINILDKEACLAYAKENAIDAVMTFGATLPLPTVAFIGENLNLPTVSTDVAELSVSKYKIKKRLDAAGCNIKGSYSLISEKDKEKSYEFFKPCVVKPCDGSGSKGVVIVKNECDFLPAIEYSLSKARYGEVYCEEWISGEEYSVEAFANGNDIQVYAIVKTTFKRTGNDNESIDYGHRTPAGISEELEAKIKQEAIKATKALGITMGSVNYDVMVSQEDGKPYIIDCGVRVGQNLIYSHIVPLSRGVNILDNTINQALGMEIETEPSRNDCIATRLLIYNPGIILEIKPMDGLIGKDGIVDIVLRKKVGDCQPEYKEKSDTCGWVICKGSTPDEAELSAVKAKAELQKYIMIK